MKKLIISDYEEIRNLPSSITSLEISGYDNSGCRSITFFPSYVLIENLVEFPPNLEEVILGKLFDQPVTLFLFQSKYYGLVMVLTNHLTSHLI
jgi:hypothetical protein